uniref:Secreted protein n=1 Tax=Ciona savignyi TaxID=51511 RepID=H2ZJF5_CIOSA
MLSTITISSVMGVFILLCTFTLSDSRAIGRETGFVEEERSGRAIKSLCVDYYSQLPYALWKHACGSQTTVRRSFEPEQRTTEKKHEEGYMNQNTRMVNALYARLFDKVSKEISEQKRSANVYGSNAPMYII